PLHPRRGAPVRGRLTAGLALLRTTGLAALVLLLWNPATWRRDPASAPPLVLLDASLSMAGHGGRWREALDSARALAQGGRGGRGGRGGVIWRFGSRVRAFDSLPPADGATRLAPARAGAAWRGGIVSADLTLPASRISHPGWVAVEVGLDGVGDEEPRDDARWFTLEVSPQPSVVLLASPPDWDSRFLARTLSDVARVPVRTFVESEPDGGGWRDAANL